uniref:Triose phosphate transporter n=1 Tax=Antonospora locustae TaxID=278021 RepID=B6UKX9_ANTLO|nr:triose phosphate transporter [Antonospora locustae]|eukprot:jgi/Antlo1/1191/1098
MKRLKIAAYTLTYYATSLMLGFFSSYFLNEKAYNFRYPLFTSGCQNMIHFILATLVLAVRKRNVLYRPNLHSLPCAVIAAIDIGVSSYALRNISLAFYTMVKSSAPVFILLCGFALGIEKLSFFLFFLMFTIGGGVFLTSMVDTCFDMYGFGLVSIASFMAGLRWALVQYLIHKKCVRSAGVTVTIQELCLPISILLLLCSCGMEGIPTIVRSEFLVNAQKSMFNAVFIILSGCLSFSLILAEFALVDQASVIYLSMSGIVKELIIIIYSVMRNTISLSRVNVAGLFISIAGIIIFNLTITKRIVNEGDKDLEAAEQQMI